MKRRLEHRVVSYVNEAGTYGRKLQYRVNMGWFGWRKGIWWHVSHIQEGDDVDELVKKHTAGMLATWKEWDTTKEIRRL